MLRSILLVVLFLFLPASVQGQVGIDTKFWEWTETAEHHKSVVRVIGKAGGTEHHGTGVVISENRVVTAFHVVEGSTSFFAVSGDKRIEFLLGPVDATHDVCILVAKQKLDLPVVKVADNYPDENTKVEVCGFGGMGSLRHFSAELRLFSGNKLGIDAYVISGDSGGPVFNDEKELIGVVSGGIDWSVQTIVTGKYGQVKATWPIRCGGIGVIEELLRK